MLKVEIDKSKNGHECEPKLLKDAIDFVCKICGYHRREYDNGDMRTLNFGDRRTKHYGAVAWKKGETGPIFGEMP